ncbi:rhodanese-like domain-containing protein [Paenibacillus sp. NPDC058174]|uniref:rhodanese-like domain-containing protein n=1 Tax=Paenibacillus sp. NPDC058174 TaxID=3346366 RepID=UPI0036DBAED0
MAIDGEFYRFHERIRYAIHMLLLYVLIIVGGIWLIHQLWPVRSLTFLRSGLREALLMLPHTAKVLDVRDAADYGNEHLPDSVNVSLGRLPFVWKTEFNPQDEILIVADHIFAIKRAARILQRRGFRKLYAVRTPVAILLKGEKQRLNGEK